MRLKLWIKKHRKGCLYLLIFIVLTRILLATHYVGAWSSNGQWKVMCHQALPDNPHHFWDGWLYFYGVKAPEKIYVKRTIDGWSDEEYMECENEGFWDDHTGDYENFDLIFFNLIAPSLPARGSYSFLDLSDRPDSGKIEIKWEEDGEMKYAVVEWP
ncbi:MAG TPA: hypothetical protein H9968_11475 [Candidatus Anaerobutyricum stercoris]|uniref:Uncharacterized protein n=1 Tax=Candidatus Anaerobutyricum stercoris TaxID=2838457 RepID=A0A9D2ENA3_9FIRM|nr:hypothetical protein [Eubacterium sp. An3]OUO25815.1 hypothetical protein B5F87_16150 [Eubacterium sp. An3]HIZ40515.1 hypothetical protein [Candidatus Anaerobutyricum stercoris]